MFRQFYWQLLKATKRYGQLARPEKHTKQKFNK